MTAFSVPDWLLEVSKLAGAIAAIIGALLLVSKTRGGKYFRWVFRRIVTEPLRGAAVELIETTVTPQLDRLEAKNDAQHGENKVALAENKAAIEGLIASQAERHAENTRHIGMIERIVTHVRESIVEHRVEVDDHLHEIRKTLDAHFGEAAVRDRRIEALEQGIRLEGVDVTITATPTSGEVPIVDQEEEQP